MRDDAESIRSHHLALHVASGLLASAEGVVLDGVEDTDATPQGDDTAVVEIPCSSIKFLPDSSGEGATSEVSSIFNDVLSEGALQSTTALRSSSTHGSSTLISARPVPSSRWVRTWLGV